MCVDVGILGEWDCGVPEDAEIWLSQEMVVWDGGMDGRCLSIADK